MSEQDVHPPAQQLAKRNLRSRLCWCFAALVWSGVALPVAGEAATFTVTTNADSGPGSLRDAITQSNGGVPIGSRNTITFALPAPVAPITTASDLPAITEPVLIDGLSQAGSRANQDPLGFDAVLPIQLVGTSGTGLRTAPGLNGGTVTISGLRVDGFTTGIDSNSPGLRLEVIGSEISGSVTDRTGRTGVVLRRSSQFDVVGGAAISATTLVTDEGTGVRLLPGTDPNATGMPQVDGSLVRDSDVGVELSTFGAVVDSLVGTFEVADVGRQGTGVIVNARSSIANSAISGNGVGVDIRAPGANVSGNLVSDNLSTGVVVSAGSGASFIGEGAGSGNEIVDNGGAGVAILSGAGTTVTGNAIDRNGGLGIDLKGDGPTPNDPLDLDDLDAFGAVLPNRLQNSPVVVDASTTGGATTISGRFQGRPGISFTFELFDSPSCDPSEIGEGYDRLARGVGSTDSAGNASVSGAIPALPDGTVLTATITTSDDGTSEFSPCTASHPAPPVPVPPLATGAGTSVIASDRIAPKLTSLSVVPSRFAAAARPTPVKASKVARGASVHFVLSETAQAQLGIARLVAGRKVGAKCQRITRKNRGRARCTRVVPVGTINRAGTAGANRVPFSGRIASHALAPGAYRLTARAVDAAGNAAVPRTAKFTVLRNPTRSSTTRSR